MACKSDFGAGGTASASTTDGGEPCGDIINRPRRTPRVGCLPHHAHETNSSPALSDSDPRDSVGLQSEPTRTRRVYIPRFACNSSALSGWRCLAPAGHTFYDYSVNGNRCMRRENYLLPAATSPCASPNCTPCQGLCCRVYRKRYSDQHETVRARAFPHYCWLSRALANETTDHSTSIQRADDLGHEITARRCVPGCGGVMET